MDFLAKYHIVSNKLKKRFLRKPNVTEASDQFSLLASECEQQELWHYAAFCWLAAARCQGTLDNIESEINYLVKAGRQFLFAEKKNNDIGCSSIGQENIQSAITCFGHSILRCGGRQGLNTLASSFAMELAIALGPTATGIKQLRKAIELFPTPVVIKILVSYHMKHGDFVTALYVLTELVELIELNTAADTIGYHNDILHKYEVTRLLLLLILQPSPQRLTPSFAQVLEKYAWVEENTITVNNMSEDELLLLQSLVLACQSHDYQAILELESELWPYLDAEQKELLSKLLQVMNTP